MNRNYKTIAELSKELKDDRFLKSIEKAIVTTKEFARATALAALKPSDQN